MSLAFYNFWYFLPFLRSYIYFRFETTTTAKSSRWTNKIPRLTRNLRNHREAFCTELSNVTGNWVNGTEWRSLLRDKLEYNFPSKWCPCLVIQCAHILRQNALLHPNFAVIIFLLFNLKFSFFYRPSILTVKINIEGH